MAGKIRVTTRDPGTISPIRNEKATREEVWTAINSNEYRDLIAEIGRLLAELRKNNATSAHLAKAQEMLNRKMSAEHALGVGMGQYSRYQRGYTRSGFRYTQTIDTTPYYKAIKNNKGLDESFRRQYTKVIMWDHQFSKKIGALGRAIYKQHLTHPTIQTAKLVDIVTKLGALTQTAGTAFMSRPHSLQMGNWNKKRAERTYFTEQNDAFVAAVDALRAKGVGSVPNTFMPSGLSIPGGTGPGGMFSYQGSLAQKLGESSKTELASQFAPLFMRSLTDAIENTPNDDMAVAISEKITDGIKKVGMESAAKQALINTFGLKRGLIPRTEWGAQLLLNILNGIPHYADGGIVDKGTIALVGEAGPEAIVPLDKMPHFANGGIVDGNSFTTFGPQYDDLFTMNINPMDSAWTVLLKDIQRILKDDEKNGDTIAGYQKNIIDGFFALRDEYLKMTGDVASVSKQYGPNSKMLNDLLKNIDAHLSSMTGIIRDIFSSRMDAPYASYSNPIMDANGNIAYGNATPLQASIDTRRAESLVGANYGAAGFVSLKTRGEAIGIIEKWFKSWDEAAAHIDKYIQSLYATTASRNLKKQAYSIKGLTSLISGGAIGGGFDPNDPKWAPMRAAASKRKAERTATPYEEPDLTGLTNLISNPSSELNGGPLKKSFKDVYKEKTSGLAEAMSGLFGGDVSKAKGITGKLSVAIGNKASSMLGAGKLAGGALLGGIALGVGSIVALLNKLVKASPVLQGVLDLFNLAVNMLLMPLGNAIGEKMLPAVLEMVTWAVDVGGPALATLVDAGQWVWDFFAGDQFQGIFDAIDMMKDGQFLEGLGKLLYNLLMNVPWIKMLVSFWQQLWSWIKPAWDTLSNTILTPIKSAIGAIVQALDSIGNFGGGIVDNVKGFLGLASGGLVMGTPFGTPAIIGEGGQSELIVPLDEVQETFNGGKGITIVFQGPVYGMNDFKRTVTDIASEAINSARYR